MFDLKTRKIRSLADEFVPDREIYGKDATLVGAGFTITYDMLANLSRKPSRPKSRWASRLGFGK